MIIAEEDKNNDWKINNSNSTDYHINKSQKNKWQLVSDTKFVNIYLFIILCLGGENETI